MSGAPERHANMFPSRIWLAAAWQRSAVGPVPLLVEFVMAPAVDGQAESGSQASQAED
jgi:hypothetical protein